MSAQHSVTINPDADFGEFGALYPSFEEASFDERASVDLSAYFYELECYLIRVDRAQTHYEVLGVDFLATTGEVTAAYLKGIILLDPTACGVNSELPEELASRVSVVKERLSEAFHTLMNFDQRLAYDSALFGWENRVISGSVASLSSSNAKPRTATSAKDSNRRISERFELSIPVTITGFDESGEDWHETAQSVDLSRSGGCILIRKRLLVGNIVYLRMPMPTVLRSHEFIDQTYGTYAVIRWIRPPRDGFRLVGVQFIGEFPPPGFRQHPWATFNINSWDGRDRRMESRETISEAIEIEFFDDNEHLIRKDSGFIEDISIGGARICAEKPPESDLIRIIRPKVSLSAFAVVRNRFKGRDGYDRICTQFIGGGCPTG